MAEDRPDTGYAKPRYPWREAAERVAKCDEDPEEVFARFLKMAQALCPRCTPGWNIGTLCPDCIDLFAPAAGCGDDADAITALWRSKEIGECAECQGVVSGCVDPEHGMNDPVEDKVSVCADCKCRILGTDAQGAELRALWEAREETP